MEAAKRAEIEPFPERMQEKGVLRRAVQLAKRGPQTAEVSRPCPTMHE